MAIRMITVIFTLLSIGTPVAADDVDDLEAASDAVIAEVNARDAEGIAAFFADGDLFFGANNPHLMIRDNAAIEENLKAFYDAVENYSYVITDRTARVFGDTGLTASTSVITSKLKGDPVVRTLRFRLLTTWTKMDGQWKIVGTHQSWFPSGKPPF